jgi:predicted dehydrogenase
MKRRDFVRKSAMGAGTMVASGVLGAAAADPAGGKSKIRIGQWGIGHAHASERMRALRKLKDDFEVVGVVDDRDQTSGIVRGKDTSAYEGLTWMKEEDLFASPGLQAVMVETGNRGLVPAAMKCIERGHAVCMDKPGGENFDDYRKLLDGCRQRNLPFQIAYMLRSNPAIQLIWKAVRGGWLGDVHEIQASMSHDYGNAEYGRYVGEYPGGTMFLLGCHHVDWITAMMGAPVRVTPFLGSTKRMAGKGKNNCLAVLEYEDGIASIHVTDAEVDGLNNRRIKVCGSKGTIELSPIERFDGKPLVAKLRLKEATQEHAKGTHAINLPVRTDRYVDQLKEFAAMLRGEVQSPYTLDHDLLVQEILLSAAGYSKWRSPGPEPAKG